VVNPTLLSTDRRSVRGHTLGDAKIGYAGDADPGRERMEDHVLEEYLERIAPADQAAMRAAEERHARLTKPAGSLGVLEELSVKLAGMTGAPAVPGPAVVTVFAADHGVHAQNVSP
jgi:nicotinate-nucleotide--dimethylbenzimidazole phosphoribosyltransferase